MSTQPQPYTPSLPPRLPTDMGSYVHRELQRLAGVIARLEARIKELEDNAP